MSRDVSKGDRARRQVFGEEGARRRPDASMTLITSMFERPLDPGYQAAADARTRAGLPASTGRATPLLVVYLAIIGLLVGIAAADLRGREVGRAQTRQELISRIEARQGTVEESSRRVRDLQAEIDSAAATADPELVDSRTARLEQLRLADGSVAVSGPGLVVTMDDAGGTEADGDGNPRTQTDDGGRVQSRDLQIVVNSLWASGAEAIAVNDQRLTSRSAIRFAGDAILVNFRPLTRPYTIEAVGDAQAMESAFAAGPGGPYLTGLQQNFDIRTSVTTSDDLTLPSVVSTGLREARPAASTGSSASSTSSTTTTKESP